MEDNKLLAKTPNTVSSTSFIDKRQMGTAQENFDKGVQLRLEGNEAFKKQDLKQGNLACNH